MFITSAFASQLQKENLTKRSRPNPEDARDLLTLLMDNAFAKELGIDLQFSKQYFEGEANSLKESATAFRDANALPLEERIKILREMSAKAKSKKESVLDEIVPPDKMRRLQQLAHRLEIVGIGYERAFDSGWLSDKVELTEVQRSSLLPELRKIDLRVARQIEEILASAELDAAKLLTHDQKRKFDDAVGPRLHVRLKHPSEIFGSSAVRE